MSYKPKPPPVVKPETWSALRTVAEEFAALKPWEFAYDSDAVGLIDPVTGEMRIGTVLGHAGEVFAAVFYRRVGIQWILARLGNANAGMGFDSAEGMDCLKLELVPKHELWKEDLAILKAAAAKPARKGGRWPQFRSSEPGWHPWHLNQTEAEQMLADLPRLTAFFRLLAERPKLFEGKTPMDTPFLPVTLPDRPLKREDLDWRPLLLPPDPGLEPVQIPAEQLKILKPLKFLPGFECEFDSQLTPGASFEEEGRPCFGRSSLLVDRRNGMVVDMDLAGGPVPPGIVAARGLIKGLLAAHVLPERLFIRERFLAALKPLCEELGIELKTAPSLPMLDKAMAHLGQYMQSGRR